MKISDEIRNDFLLNDDVGEVAYRQLLSIADRIDRKMVELPKDAEGHDIPLDTRVLYSEDGALRNVRRFCYHVGCSKWVVAFDNGIERLTSKMHIASPDSLERVAADIESAKGWCAQNGDYGTELVSISKQKLIGWSNRIRKLAKKEDENAD